jgi:acetyl-CoA synthetase
LPARRDVGGGPALHPLHFGLDRKAKGVLHTTGGYLAFTSMTHEYVFDYRDGEIYWCTADVGWVTGHSYIVYGPLAERRDDIDVRGRAELSRSVALLAGRRQAQGVDLLHRADRDPRADARGRGLRPQDQPQIAAPPRHGRRADQPRSLALVLRSCRRQALPDRRYLVADRDGRHFDHADPRRDAAQTGFGDAALLRCRAVIVDGDGKPLDGVAEGNLCLARSWPGQMRTVYGDHNRFVETYFSTFKGLYFTGDGARRDADGFYWITGRVDDVINVAGHRLGTAEIESALVAHPKVAEAAVVGYPHDIKGQGIYAYVTLRADEQPNEALRAELVQWVRNEISAIAAPDLLQWAPSLPKTRSGKIMRRILRKIAEDQPSQLGDVSTLADPTVVDDLVGNRMNRPG